MHTDLRRVPLCCEHKDVRGLQRLGVHEDPWPRTGSIRLEPTRSGRLATASAIRCDHAIMRPRRAAQSERQADNQ